MRRTLIPPRVIMQIQLMIILRIPPSPRLQDLRRDLLVLEPLLLRRLRNPLCIGFLLRRMIEDSTPVLRASVHALPVLGGGVMHSVEELEEVGVGDEGGVKGYLEGFRVCDEESC